jgi:hypothetical protein
LTPAEHPVAAARQPLAIAGVSLGDAALAAFALCAVSGVLLLPAFDAREPVRSIAEWLLANPGAAYLRSLHYWTAQAFLVLTLLHAWDHLRLATPRRLSRGAWTRLVLSLPVLAFLMLSGFLLRGDSDAQQARRILESVLAQLPLVGTPAAGLLFGTDESALQVVYLQHAATATLIVWLVIFEHARRLWGGLRASAAMALATGVLAGLVSPGLHDGHHPVVKGPWYFLGLQELLHWSAWPLLWVGAAALALLGLWWTARWAPPLARRARRGLFGALGLYFVLCAVVLFARGENWSLQPGWPAGPGDLRAGPLLERTTIAARTAKLPVILGRPEGCMACHADLTGFSPAHQPQSVGCASCHLGDTFTLDKARAHAGMVRVPGNLADAALTCGNAACHADIVPRVERSIMATFAGVVATNRRVFGEDPAQGARPGQPPHVRDLGHSAADSHLRQLCVACHLGQPKTEWTPITQESRGGGCNACHLKYSPAAEQALIEHGGQEADQRAAMRARGSIPKVHPALTVQADGSHCFGCHSRSSRIATSYEGWHELRHDPKPAELAASAAHYRQLDDGRFFVRKAADVHHERGMDCIDCHTALEVMGTGRADAHKAQSLRVRCEDCHAAKLGAQALNSADPESLKILALRGWSLAPGERLGSTRSGDTLLNVVVDAQGRGTLRHKADGRVAPLHAPAAVCTQGAGHERLSCSSCHTAWAPQCNSCHTAFDAKGEGFDHLTKKYVPGEWMESSVDFDAGAPTLGIRLASGLGERGGEVVDTFIPGMIMTLDRKLKAGAPPDTLFRRLFAPISAHTTQRQARACTSCHNDPLALGYGSGKLTFEVTLPRRVKGEAAAPGHGDPAAPGGRSGRWRFVPARPALPQDGLPEDAWTGFLAERKGMLSTQAGARPFSLAEQQRILTVGACLSCHAGDSKVMLESLRDFPALLRRRSAQCAVPDWG